MRFTLDNLPSGRTDWRRVAATTDAEIDAQAVADGTLLTDAELAEMVPVPAGYTLQSWLAENLRRRDEANRIVNALTSATTEREASIRFELAPLSTTSRVAIKSALRLVVPVNRDARSVGGRIRR